MFHFVLFEEQARMCFNLYTEEHIFILQRIHSFIIEHLLWAWLRAKIEAIKRRRQLHSMVGKSLANAHPWCTMRSMLIKMSTKFWRVEKKWLILPQGLGELPRGMFHLLSWLWISSRTPPGSTEATLLKSQISHLYISICLLFVLNKKQYDIPTKDSNCLCRNLLNGWSPIKHLGISSWQLSPDHKANFLLLFILISKEPVKTLLTIPWTFCVLAHHDASLHAIDSTYNILSPLAHSENSYLSFKAQFIIGFSVNHVLMPPQVEWFVLSLLVLRAVYTTQYQSWLDQAL